MLGEEAECKRAAYIGLAQRGRLVIRLVAPSLPKQAFECRPTMHRTLDMLLTTVFGKVARPSYTTKTSNLPSALGENETVRTGYHTVTDWVSNMVQHFTTTQL